GGDATQLAVSDDGTTYIGNADNLTAWDATGKHAGSYAGPCDQPVIDGAGNLYVVCDAVLTELDPTLTTVLSSYDLGLQAGQSVNDSPVIGPNNTLYMTLDSENN